MFYQVYQKGTYERLDTEQEFVFSPSGDLYQVVENGFHEKELHWLDSKAYDITWVPEEFDESIQDLLDEARWDGIISERECKTS